MICTLEKVYDLQYYCQKNRQKIPRQSMYAFTTVGCYIKYLHICYEVKNRPFICCEISAL